MPIPRLFSPKKGLFAFSVLLLVLTGCEKEEELSVHIKSQSFTVKLGDTITVKGSNLREVGEVIFASDGSLSTGPPTTVDYFPSHTDSEIKVIVPELNAEKGFLSVAGERLDLNIIGLFPLKHDFNDSPFLTYYEEDIRVIDEEVAFVLPRSTLIKLSNGYYDATPVAEDVDRFGFFDDQQGWYVKSESNYYEIFYTSNQAQDYNLLTSFSIDPAIDVRFVYAVTKKEILVSTDQGVFLMENGELVSIGQKFSEYNNFDPKHRDLNRILSKGGQFVYGTQGHGNIMSFDFERNEARFIEMAEGIRNVDFFGNTIYATAWAVKGKLLKKTEDGGETWKSFSGPEDEFYAPPYAEFADKETGFLFSNDYNKATAWITEDGGVSWNKYYNFYRAHDGIRLGGADFKGNSGLLCCNNKGELFKLVKE